MSSSIDISNNQVVAASASISVSGGANKNGEKMDITIDDAPSHQPSSMSTSTKPMTHVVSNASVKPPSPTASDIEMAPPNAVSQDSVAAPTKLAKNRVSLSPDFLVGEAAADSKMPASTNNEDDAAMDVDSSVRRTGRKRTSTTMIIDGHVVKKQNNYTVTAGEYIHGAYIEDQPKPKKKPKANSKSNGAARAPRKMPSYITERQKHNDIIKKRLYGVDATNQLNFMTNNYDSLEPFIDSKVKNLLQSNMAKAKPEPTRPVLGTQPDLVKTTLRDYQMIGLDWMTNMHSRGMPFILGDEMGLGKTLQTISLIAHLKEHHAFSGPSLVICPLSVLYSWCNEVSLPLHLFSL